MKKLFLCYFVLFAACESGYEEIRDGNTAEVYACGDWQIKQINQIIASIDDWNANITLSSGNKPFHFGGVLLEEDTYEESDIDDGLHCIYRVYDHYPTPYGRELWQDHHIDQNAGGLFDEGDDIVIFGNNDCHVTGTPDGWPCTWMIQHIVAHELGHAGWLHHADDGTDSVMISQPGSKRVTTYDRQAFCRRNRCL
ncbi:MAG: hypothetical protein G01um101413_860 [Parcubacteria group bacterium Gr01-1014_13]|nr:MAG: hypothetical protein G01um101413_860 [Parcubacteria group bacterium Gr01-1014_13]